MNRLRNDNAFLIAILLFLGIFSVFTFRDYPIFSYFGVFLILVALYDRFVFSKSDNKRVERLKREGVVVLADFESIEVDIISDTSGHHLKFRSKDGKNVFLTEDFYPDISDVAGTKLRSNLNEKVADYSKDHPEGFEVLVNPKDMSNYYIDTTWILPKK